MTSQQKEQKQKPAPAGTAAQQTKGIFHFQVNLGGMLDVLSNHLYKRPDVFLPQIPLEQWQELMQQFWLLVKRYHVGLRTYWWQMCRFWQYIDKEEAFKYFEKFWKTGRDDISDCRACERSYAVHMSLLIGDRKSADTYAKPMDDGRLWFCHDTPHIYIFAYLEDAMNRGDLREAERRARNLYGKSDRDRNDLSYLGAVLRCWAFTDLDRGVELIQKRLEWTFNM